MKLYKLTRKMIRNYCEAIEIGATRKMAAAYVGVHPETLRTWFARAEAAEAKPEAERDADDALCMAFADAVAQAQGVAGMTWQQVVSEAANVDPNWAWKMLQVRFPDDYKQAPTVSVDTTIEVKQVFDHARVVAALASRPVADSDPSGADEGAGDGAALG